MRNKDGCSYGVASGALRFASCLVFLCRVEVF
jgi:hypothetical protein